MARILLRLTALSMLAAFSEQMISDGSVKSGVRLIEGLIAAEMILEMVIALPAAVFPGG